MGVCRVAGDDGERLDAEFLCVERRISTRAAAPSAMELELAAVTVPPSRKAGLSSGIFSSFALGGCSSCVTVNSDLDVFTVTGAISAAKVPSAMAFCARARDVAANRSCGHV